jgi:hypothetical protein
LPPLSEGASKLGETLNLIRAVTVSEFEIVNSAASAPDEIVTVADSETLIVAAAEVIAMFSAAEKEEEEVKVGAVVSVTVIVAEVVEIMPVQPVRFIYGELLQVPELLSEYVLVKVNVKLPSVDVPEPATVFILVPGPVNWS